MIVAYWEYISSLERPAPQCGTVNVISKQKCISPLPATNLTAKVQLINNVVWSTRYKNRLLHEPIKLKVLVISCVCFISIFAMSLGVYCCNLQLAHKYGVFIFRFGIIVGLNHQIIIMILHISVVHTLFLNGIWLELMYQ